ncbi:MAG: TIGR03790 family protein [Thermodesulfobacteriota bacterium]|nr:TIGR03790 family protein [Thermodesulfobacteriota bacterium]
MRRCGGRDRLLLICSCLLLLQSSIACALEPLEIAVIANNRVPESIELAHYYMQQRQIPDNHLILIDASNDETCSRKHFNQAIRDPILQQINGLADRKKIRCLVTIYGVPLRIHRQQVDTSKEKGAGKDDQAAVDSELALILSGSYPLDGWLANPYFLGFRQTKTVLKRDNVLMVSRLDGPDPAIVRRIIDDSISTERNGLQGRACFDARWPKSEKNKPDAYGLYDSAIHRAAELVRSRYLLPVRLDSKSELFQQGDCPNTALYCGWYSLARYIDAFTWTKGSVGFHVASSECSTLKRKDSQVWCKRMLENGIGATIGPVFEPYVLGFPQPDIFFGHLVDGYLSLAECYLISLPYLSWQMVLIGDPLYLPFSHDNKTEKLLEKK